MKSKDKITVRTSGGVGTRRPTMGARRPTGGTIRPTMGAIRSAMWMSRPVMATVTTEGAGSRHIEKLPLVAMKEALDNGGRVTLLIRHAERPPLDPTDRTFGASLPLTENGWRWARNFGLMLANNLLPQTVAFYASETFRTLQTACGMAMGLEGVGTGQSIERKVRLAEFLGGESPFFGNVEDRMALAAEGDYHNRLNDYFHSGKLRGFKPLKRAAKRMARRLDGLHEKGWPFVVAVTHDINVAAFLAARGVVDSFSDETWPGYLDAAALIKRDRKNEECLYFRWENDMGAIHL